MDTGQIIFITQYLPLQLVGEKCHGSAGEAGMCVGEISINLDRRSCNSMLKYVLISVCINNY